MKISKDTYKVLTSLTTTHSGITKFRQLHKLNEKQDRFCLSLLSSASFWVQTLNHIFGLILPQFYCAKNVKKAYFDWPLECAAPKGWSKYTTNYLVNYVWLRPEKGPNITEAVF